MEHSSAVLQYKLPEFEGPLDLLLTLISKNKINICDIQISQLLEQYMEQISRMQEQNMDVASEFLEMASRLVYIKSVFLLPKHEEEAKELKKELEGQLIEYQLCRKTAAMLGTMANFDTFCRGASPVEYDLTYKRKHPPEDIARGYESACGRGKRRLPPPAEAFSGIVAKRIVSVGSRIVHVLRRLKNEKDLTYGKLFETSTERGELVATFLAVLELVKGKRIRIEGDGEDAQVKVTDNAVDIEKLQREADLSYSKDEDEDDEKTSENAETNEATEGQVKESKGEKI